MNRNSESRRSFTEAPILLPTVSHSLHLRERALWISSSWCVAAALPSSSRKDVTRVLNSTEAPCQTQEGRVSLGLRSQEIFLIFFQFY